MSANHWSVTLANCSTTSFWSHWIKTILMLRKFVNADLQNQPTSANAMKSALPENCRVNMKAIGIGFSDNILAIFLKIHAITCYHWRTKSRSSASSNIFSWKQKKTTNIFWISEWMIKWLKMDSNPTDSTVNPPSLSDPNLVNTLVEELKSKGIFDQIRGDALAEVDTKVNLFLGM